MGEIFDQVRNLIGNSEARISEHGYDALLEDGTFARDLVAGISNAVPIEEYPDYPKGPCVLVLQTDRDDRPVHVVWGIPKGTSSPAVLVTAYQPDPERWTSDFMRRK